MGKKILVPFSSLVSEIWSFTIYFSGKRRSLLHPNTAQGARKYKRNVLIPPGHPTILLKSNEFNMAAV